MAMRIVAAMLCSLCACADVTVLRYVPSKTPITMATVDHGRASLSLPARGEAIGVRLADGFPVWVVHHEDGTVSVVSAVAPLRPKRAGYAGDDVAAQVARSLVSWIPGVRRFYGGGILFDERGHVLGYAAFDGCAGECPRIEDMPQYLHDLDSFEIAAPAGSATIDVGKLVAGESRRAAATWLPWRRPAARKQDMLAADSPALPRLSVRDALTLPDGHYAIVDGDAVRSTDAEPVICTASRAGTCGACGTDRLQLAGIAASDAAHIHRSGWWRDPAEYSHDRNAVYLEAEPGTFLVQRQGAAFQIVAGIFRGDCGGGS